LAAVIVAFLVKKFPALY